ncbi:MAG: PAS domain-containing protein [Clostridia bacterium]|nr:PAS domain-containing protein [Clostridia bacterium]
MKKSIFLRSFAIALLSVLILFVSGIGVTYFSNKSLVSERLVTETELAAALLNDTADFDKLDVFQNRDECRITVISTSGDVLYDSDIREPLENHIDREEVAAAIAGTPKTVERYSETFGCKMTYYAVPTRFTDGSEAILRLAVKSAEINGYIISTIPFLCIALILSAVIAGIFARKLSESVANRITDISGSLKSVNNGNYMPLKTDMQDSEFYAVYDEINVLNSKTASHIRREENEREKLNAVLDNISQGIIALSDDEKIVLINGSALSLFGSNDSVVSKDLVYLIDDRSLLNKITNAPRNANSRFEFPFGEKTLLVEIILPQGEILRDEIGSIIILSDITVQRDLARQKEEFFANASHELKTPLTAMLGLTELALAKSKEDGTKKQLERIHKESLRLSDLISDMLKLSRLEALHDENTAVCVSMDEVACEVIAELSEAMKAKRITASVSGKATVWADEKRMFELMQNLLSNAVNYNKDGGTIEAIFEETSKAAILRVKDTGIGIAKENIPHLCERFYRVDKSRSKKTGGTGLGLAIVKHICALYDAEISINSEIDVGTEFVIVFKKDK